MCLEYFQRNTLEIVQMTALGRVPEFENISGLDSRAKMTRGGLLLLGYQLAWLLTTANMSVRS